jgi:hypothetical protein
MNPFNIRRTFEDKKRKGWERIYIAIDLHDTVIEGKYNRFNEGANIFPYAREFFKWAVDRDDVILILWTSSHDDAIKKTLAWLREEGIYFDYINKNPLETTNQLCDFDKKFYFNILLDDKAGFEGETDWKLIIDELKAIGEYENR